VAGFYDVRLADLLSCAETNHRPAAADRHVAGEHTATVSKNRQLLRREDHTTVMYAIRAVDLRRDAIHPAERGATVELRLTSNDTLIHCRRRWPPLRLSDVDNHGRPLHSGGERETASVGRCPPTVAHLACSESGH
jgi:hypothetical protein